jgi:beta-lactamase regulating signal transducer with metallopeptidase domain
MKPLVSPLTLAWIVGIVLAVVVIFAVIRRWLLDKAERDEAEFVKQMEEQLKQIRVIEEGQDPPELPPGVGA